MFDGLVAFAVDRCRHDCDTRRVWFISWSRSPMKEGRFVLGIFRSERMRVLYRSRQDDRLCRILFGDEAHFWLNGYVNKQNCRIWSEANPQVYVETPLHPEKLTVWRALWAGGILLQKR
ncbi:DUF4817 domain-containing protein [Trichonephila clavipes]|nr:DUF4817 domain-containing protein [Trichonephila clavipes]